MKKLSLKKLNLESNDLLQREQLKTVFGGYDGAACNGGSCQTDSDCPGSCKCKDGSPFGSDYCE